MYELYTGEFLFYEKNWGTFFEKITKENVNIFNDDFNSKLSNNVFLIDTIKYILNRYP